MGVSLPVSSVVYWLLTSPSGHLIFDNSVNSFVDSCTHKCMFRKYIAVISICCCVMNDQY